MAAGEILGVLGRVNLAAAAAILVVVALRKLVRPRFGARLAYSLWLLPLLAAAAVLAPARAVVVAAAPLVTGQAPMPFIDGALPAGLPVSAAAKPDLAMLAVGLWLAGVVVAGLVMAYLQRRFSAEVRKGAIGPAVVGVIAPRIVTPADFELKFSGEEQALVLAHERAHIARQDSRLNGLSAALQCLFWFNPLIHIAAHLMRIDQEMACDETVVTHFPDARRAYAQALVKAQLAIRPLPLGCYWPSGTEHPLLERIAMLKLNDISRRRRLAGASALAVLCAATGFTAWASQPPHVRTLPSPLERAAAPEALAPAPRPADATVHGRAVRLAVAEAVPPTQAAATGDQAMIRRIDVVGADRTGAAAVVAALPVKVGDTETPANMDASLKALFATRQFADVKIRFEQGVMRVALVEPPPEGGQPLPRGPRGGQPAPAGPGPGAPPPGEAPPAVLERPWDANSVINPAATKTIDGVVNAVKWSYPSSEIWVRETASGQMVVINTDGAAALFAAGIDRQALRPGTPITVKGYPARNGSRLYADPAEIVAGGKAARSTPTAGLPQLLSQRLAVCGDMSKAIFPAGPAAQDPKAAQAAIAAWRADCDAKLAKAGD